MTSDETANELASQSGITFAGNIIRLILGFGFVIAATRLLGSSLYGQFVLGLSITTFTLGLLNLRIHKAVDYFVPQSLANDSAIEASQTFVTVLFIALIGSLVSAALVIALADQFATAFDEPKLGSILIILGLALPLRAVNKVLFTGFIASKRMGYRVMLRDAFFPAAKFVGFLLLFASGFGLFSLVYGYILGVILTVVLGSVLLMYRLAWFNLPRRLSSDKRSLIQYSAPLALAGVVSTILAQIDYILIGYYLPSDSVGVYKVGFEISRGLLVVLLAVTPIFKPMIAEVLGDSDAVRSRYSLATRWIIIFTFPMFATLALASDVYLSLLFTNSFNNAWVVIVVLSIGYFISAVSGPEGMVLEGLGYTRITLFNNILMLIINIGLGVLLIPKFGIGGAAVATACAIGVSAGAGVFEVWYLEGIHPYDHSTVKLVACGTALFPVFLPIVIWNPSRIVVALSLPVLTPIVYILLVRSVNGFSEEDFYVAERIDSRIGFPILTRLVVPRQ